MSTCVKLLFWPSNSNLEWRTCLLSRSKGSRAFFETVFHIFVNLSTGSGKSLIYQSLPIVADILHGRPHVSSTILVISPPEALMKDHINDLQNHYFPAIAVVDKVSEDPEYIQQIMNGLYTHIYGSPKCLLALKHRGTYFHVRPSVNVYGCLGDMTSLIL